MNDNDRSTDDLLREQLRVLRKADKRGGCLWNIVMLVLFSLPYLVWLTIKRIVKAIRWLVVRAWRATKWTAIHVCAGIRWTGRKVQGLASRS